MPLFKSLIIWSFFSLCFINISAQEKIQDTFQFFDKEFEVGQVKYFRSSDLFTWRKIKEFGILFSDSLATMMKEHPNIQIQINTNSGFDPLLLDNTGSQYLIRGAVIPQRKFLVELLKRGIRRNRIRCVQLPDFDIEGNPISKDAPFSIEISSISIKEVPKSEPEFFQLSDTIFKVGQVYHFPIDTFFEKNKDKLKPDIYPILDSLATKIGQHSSLKLEFFSYKPGRDSYEFGIRHDIRRLEAIMFYFMNRDVQRRQLRMNKTLPLLDKNGYWIEQNEAKYITMRVLEI